jgi:hypothetical protein
MRAAGVRDAERSVGAPLCDSPTVLGRYFFGQTVVSYWLRVRIRALVDADDEVPVRVGLDVVRTLVFGRIRDGVVIARAWTRGATPDGRFEREGEYEGGDERGQRLSSS